MSTDTPNPTAPEVYVDPADLDDGHTLADVLDVLDDVARTLWPLVDDIAAARHDEQDGPRRVELRAVQEHTAQAWAQAQHAVTVLRTLVVLDGPADDLDERVERAMDAWVRCTGRPPDAPGAPTRAALRDALR